MLIVNRLKQEELLHVTLRSENLLSWSSAYAEDQLSKFSVYTVKEEIFVGNLIS